jgi:hypothetical protein
MTVDAQAETDFAMKHVLKCLQEQARAANDDPAMYKLLDGHNLIECPRNITITPWNGPMGGYNPGPRRTQGVTVRSDGAYGRAAYREIGTLNRVYRFNQMRVKASPEDNDFTFNAKAAHKCVMERASILKERGDSDAAKAEMRTQNAAVAIASLRANSIQSREDRVEDDPHDPLSLHRIPYWKMTNEDWEVIVSQNQKSCTVRVAFDLHPEDVGPTLRALLSAKHSAAIECNFDHYPFTVVRNALDIIPHIIEDRLVIPENIRDKIDLRLISQPYAEWLDFAGRAIGHVAVQVATWEVSKFSGDEPTKKKVGTHRQVLADLEVEIRSIARKVDKASLDGEALEERLATIRNKLAEAHARLCYYLAECSP